jgi:hypothetical protein
MIDLTRDGDFRASAIRLGGGFRLSTAKVSTPERKCIGGPE